MTVRRGRHFLQIPGPSNSPDRILHAIGQPTMDHRGPDFALLGKEVLGGMRKIFQTEHPVVIYPSSGTGAWEAALVNLFNPGDTLLMVETGQFASLWKELAERLGYKTEFIEGDWRRGVQAEQVEARLKADKAGAIRAVCMVHNETSTGVSAPVRRVAGADSDALMVVDATSAAGGIYCDVRESDVYYFAPQKNFASDGGLWFALMSPAAIARAAEIADTDRYIPDFLSLTQAIDNSRLHQTLNTPALTTLLLMEAQLEWMLSIGGLTATAAHCAASSAVLYDWADSRSDVTAFVRDPDHRSPVVVTLDIDEAIDATAITSVLRANGIVDTEPYRKLGRNQIRVATFAGVPHSAVEKLISSLDYVLENL